MKKIFFTAIVILLLAGCVKTPTSYFKSEVSSQAVKHAISTQDEISAGDKENQENQNVNININKQQPEVIEEPEIGNSEIPKTFDQNIAFAPQAPFGIWDEVHEEACEEASMIMVARYIKGQNLNEQIMAEEIQKLVTWEENNGYKVDLTAQETVEVLRDYFGIKAHVVADTSVEAIKSYLANGKLIIIPAAGRLLGNPYFQTPGPIYHMLVLRGYDRNDFITNDPGTKRGEAFKYDYQTLIYAIHDWDHTLEAGGMQEEEINSTRKVIIVVEK